MSGWSSSDVSKIVGAQEVRLRTRRVDGSLRSPRIIWIVEGEDRIFIRSTNGRGADWFRWAIKTGQGQLLAGGSTYDVTFTEAPEEDVALADAGYRTKYGATYASIVDHLNSPGPQAATLEVHPAS